MTKPTPGGKDIEPRIGKQIVLPWSKAVEIAAKSIRVRFWRSMITMSSIILAIAFLMSIWTSTAITASLAGGPARDIERTKERVQEVRQTLNGAPGALSPDDLKREFARELDDAIDAAHDAITEKQEAMEDAGTDQRKTLEKEIAGVEEKLAPANAVALLHEYLMERRRDYERVKGSIDTILQQERGGSGGEGPAASTPEETGKEAPAKAAAGSSVVNFISQMSPTDTWLAILALLVCLVGIANAMFMTVQERFREIGTMKCLGAVDSFIVKIFLIESATLGFVGTLLGVVAGLLLSALRQLYVYGTPSVTYFPVVNIILAGVLAALVGLVLSIGAAIWPAQKAARMEPVEAMRVEE